jgi:hypothetical protein
MDGMQRIMRTSGMSLPYMGLVNTCILPYNEIAMRCTSMDHEKMDRQSPGKIYPFLAIIGLHIFLSLILVARANAQPSADPSSLRLIGTVMAGRFTGAVLGDAKGEQTFYRLYENLPDGSQLVKVQRDHILVKRSDGAVYEIYIAHDTNTAVLQSAPPVVAAPPPPVADHPVAPAITPAGDAPLKTLTPRQRRPKRSTENED